MFRQRNTITLHCTDTLIRSFQIGPLSFLRHERRLSMMVFSRSEKSETAAQCKSRDAFRMRYGVGPVGEEGVANMVNAFIEAGAQSVVSTLWEIEDHATAQLMISFYRHLGRGEDKAEALRQAQLELMKSGDPAYFWAGFELDGEPNAKLFTKAKSNLPVRKAVMTTIPLLFTLVH